MTNDEIFWGDRREIQLDLLTDIFFFFFYIYSERF